MEIKKTLTGVNFTKGGNKRLGVVIHTMVGTLSGTDTYFKSSSSGVSSHYGVSLDGTKVYQWVEEQDVAFAQGNVSKPTFKLTTDRPGVNPNTYLISIECEDNRDPANADRSKQTPVIAELVADICKRNNIPLDRNHICGHREIRSTKTCPGNLDVDLIVKLASANIDGMPTWVKGYFTEKGIDLDNEGDSRSKLGEIFDGAKKYTEAEKARAKAEKDLVEARADATRFEELYIQLGKENKRIVEEVADLRKQITDRDAQISSLQARVTALEGKIPAEGTVTISKDEYLNLKAKALQAVKTLDMIVALLKRLIGRK